MLLSRKSNLSSDENYNIINLNYNSLKNKEHRNINLKSYSKLMEESTYKFSNDESQTFSPRSNLKINENTRKSIPFRNTSKTNDSFK